jgi:Flp pilus assembly protein TadG
MSGPFFNPIRALLKRLRRDERGSIFVMAAIMMIALLGVAGIALDMGRIYIERARLSNVADASALAAARTMRQGQTAARQQATGVAAANGFVDGQNGCRISVTFGTNAQGEQTVTVSVTSNSVQLILLKPLVDRQVMAISSQAVAGIAPIDLVLVLDQSSSLSMANAWLDLQRAAINFINLLDDKNDQVGLVSFHIRAVQRRPLQKSFITPLTNMINHMSTVDGTNLQAGLSEALNQLQPPHVRQRAVKVVVVFTDGQPNAFRAVLGGKDRILAADLGYMFGYWNNPNGLPNDDFKNPDGCTLVASCFGYTPTTANTMASTSALNVASQIRAQKTYIYSIGLGNQQSDPWLAPDLTMLKKLANVDGMVDPKQPQGKMYFAPTKADIQSAFNSVASDLLTRLVQ